jgi:hypothetical protein
MITKLKPAQLVTLLGVIFLWAFTTALQSCAPNDSSSNTDSLLPPYENYTLQTDKRNTNNNFVLPNSTSYQQTTYYTCGPAIVMSLMYHYGMLNAKDLNRNTELRIAREMGTTMDGTSQTQIVAWLQNHGFQVEYGQDANSELLLKELKDNVPTIIVWNGINGHSMMAVGYSNNKIFFADPDSSSYIINGNKTLRGINSITPDQLNLMWFDSKYIANPSRTAIGMYIIAVPSTYQ